MPKKKKKAAASNKVIVWEQDPGSGAQPDGGQQISVDAPKLSTTPLALKIPGKAPNAQVYPLGTAEFRYWALAAAARRGADLWGAILPPGSKWHSTVGSKLTLNPDQGEDLNAYYDRSGLSFFHGASAGRTVYSGESPDIVCHELGHAVLDSIRPELWDVANFEVPAFHELFGDMSAILSALQVKSLRSGVLDETGGELYRNSQLSELAEQLGWAIRQQAPTAVDPDCLRNAVNGFVYRDPMTLPSSAPAASLSREAHSLSRVFTGGFFEGLAGMVRALAGDKPPTETHLFQASQDMAKILVTAILQTPIVSTYFSQIAAHMVAVADAQPGSPYRDALRSAFVRHGILSVSAAAMVMASMAQGVEIAALVEVASAPAELPMTSISVADYGLNVDTIRVFAASQAERFGVAGAALSAGSAEAPGHEVVARSYVEDLLREGRLDTGRFGASAVTQPLVTKTHALVEEGDDVVLRRLRID